MTRRAKLEELFDLLSKRPKTRAAILVSNLALIKEDIKAASVGYSFAKKPNWQSIEFENGSVVFLFTRADQLRGLRVDALLIGDGFNPFDVRYVLSGRDSLGILERIDSWDREWICEEVT